MAQRSSYAHDDPFADLEKKTQILERELAQQRVAIERLKSLGQPARRSDDRSDDSVVPTHTRKTA